jgi:hypothetical protein
MRWWRRWRIRRGVNGRDPQSLIDASPYGYGHWQGENGYRIWDDRREPPFIGFAATEAECRERILELILATERDDE